MRRTLALAMRCKSQYRFRQAGCIVLKWLAALRLLLPGMVLAWFMVVVLVRSGCRER